MLPRLCKRSVIKFRFGTARCRRKKPRRFSKLPSPDESRFGALAGRAPALLIDCRAFQCFFRRPFRVCASELHQPLATVCLLAFFLDGGVFFYAKKPLQRRP